MKYPKLLKITYTPSIDLPVQTVESTHVITDINDLNVVVGFINTFSEYDWNDITFSQYVRFCEDNETTVCDKDINMAVYVL